MTDYHSMWSELGLDLDRHDALLAAVGLAYQSVFLSQGNRPRGMEYFDFVIGEVHGLRIQELVEHRRQGGIVVGAFCVFAPEDLMLAVGAIPVGLCAGADFAIPDAEQFLPRNTCPLIKAALGFKLSGVCPYFECCDLVVGETTCDGKKKMYEILGEHHPTYVIEVPNIKSDHARVAYVEEMKRFAARLEEVSGRTITTDSLRAATEQVHAKKRALQRLARARRARPAPISGLDALLVSQVSFYDDFARFTEKATELADELEQRIAAGEGVMPEKAPRVLISGTPAAFPYWKVSQLLSEMGVAVVGEESCVGSRYYDTMTPDNEGTLDGQFDAIAARLLGTHCACFTPNTERVDDIVRMARETEADGVIQSVLQFCQTYATEAHLVGRELDGAAIPNIYLETDYSTEDVERLRTRIEAFVEMING
jgi:benzoyl-CoA reductase/2-hydroxyglutaryl-CoA dehydratase subunit BcrC/BadD/HgdB